MMRICECVWLQSQTGASDNLYNLWLIEKGINLRGVGYYYYPLLSHHP
jgi:hypothetical protein